jgi:limonene-1,2-epoxide hydrolase
MGPSEIVLGFLQACARSDLDTALRTLTEDVEYDNVPIGKVTGREAVRGVLSGGISAAADEIEWVILRHVAQGSVVMSERVDRFRVGETWLELPVVGVFELAGERIRLWRDYFDLETYRQQRHKLLGSADRP